MLETLHISRIFILNDKFGPFQTTKNMSMDVLKNNNQLKHIHIKLDKVVKTFYRKTNYYSNKESTTLLTIKTSMFSFKVIYTIMRHKHIVDYKS